MDSQVEEIDQQVGEVIAKVLMMQIPRPSPLFCFCKKKNEKNGDKSCIKLSLLNERVLFFICFILWAYCLVDEDNQKKTGI